MTKQLLFLIGMIIGTTSFGQKYCCGESGEPQFDGNDLISYYDGKIYKGSSEYKAVIDGQLYLFRNDVNKRRFLENPQKYLASYGGWCSIAMSLDALVKPNYNYYRFDQDGKILFFEVRAFLNGITLWEKDTIGNKIKADINYKKHLNELNK